MKNTPLTDKHIALGAKMAEFAGYNMPISYSGIKDEHEAVRTKAGIFDVSHMGEFIVKGREAFNLVQWVTSNDVSKLKPGQAQYSCLPNLEGGIVDDLLVYRLGNELCEAGEEAFLLVVNASNLEKDWNWISSQNQFDTRMVNISDETGLIALQGPLAIEILSKLTTVNLKEIPYYHFAKGTVAGQDNVLISATGYTGAGGFELYARNEQITVLWEALMDAGKPAGLIPAGLGARDTLRLEMGFCLYGNDINDLTSPLEAGLGWITKTDKGAFIGLDKIRSLKKAGIQKKLVGFIVDDRRVARHGYKVFDQSEQEIGEVTSGTMSPSLNSSIGMAYVPVEFSTVGTPLKISLGSKFVDAHVSSLPFYKPA